jgi:hypothetical protein
MDRPLGGAAARAIEVRRLACGWLPRNIVTKSRADRLVPNSVHNAVDSSRNQRFYLPIALRQET